LERWNREINPLAVLKTEEHNRDWKTSHAGASAEGILEVKGDPDTGENANNGECEESNPPLHAGTLATELANQRQEHPATRKEEAKDQQNAQERHTASNLFWVTFGV
jgi:hypothetical protein